MHTTMNDTASPQKNEDTGPEKLEINIHCKT